MTAWYTNLKPSRASALVIAVAVATQLIVFAPMFSPDGTRFIAQARDLLAGNGFRTDGQLETRLPPGYAIFVALLLPLGGIGVIRLAQAVLFASSASLLYFALRPSGTRRALIVSVVFAANPWLAYRAGAILSESLGMFFCALLMWLLARLESRPGTTAAIAFGVVSVALILTSPATIALCFLLFLYVVVKRRQLAAATFAGALLLMIPWQIHSYRAIGRVSPLVYANALGNEIEPWTRSWVLRERDLWFRWHPNEIAAAPPRAFASEDQRTRLIDASRHLNEAQLIDLLQRAGREARASQPLRYDVVLPALRATLLWVDMPQLKHAQIEYAGRFMIIRDGRTVGWPRAILRFAKALLSTAGLLIYIGFPLAFAIVAWRAFRCGHIAPLCILSGILIYTLISAWLAEGEARRNFVFYPARAFAAFYSVEAPRDE